jgi:hypothetical protein
MRRPVTLPDSIGGVDSYRTPIKSFDVFEIELLLYLGSPGQAHCFLVVGIRGIDVVINT